MYGETNVFCTDQYVALRIVLSEFNLNQKRISKYPKLRHNFGKFSSNADGDALYEQKALIVKDGMLQPF
ncbi:hypothetical protein JT359_01255 [Candidatus Poribacteria bacterium]|nr:hypothetical protein [Candidatus Poribacteria bacterium]